MKINIFNNLEKKMFRESKLVFNDFLGQLWNTGEALWNTGGTALEVGGKGLELSLKGTELGLKALDFLLTLPEKGADLLENGYYHAKKAYEGIEYEFSKPSEPTSRVPELSYMWNYFDDVKSYGLEEGSDGYVAAEHHAAASYLKYRIDYITVLLSDAISEREKVKNKIIELKKLQEERDEEREQLKEDILQEKRMIAGGEIEDDPSLSGKSYEKGSPQLKKRRKNLDKLLEKYEELSIDVSTKVMWGVPRIVEVEYPIGSGVKVDRFVIDNSVQKEINIMDYYASLKDITETYKDDLGRYLDHFEYHVFYRDNAVESLKGDEKTNYQKYKTHVDGVRNGLTEKLEISIAPPDQMLERAKLLREKSDKETDPAKKNDLIEEAELLEKTAKEKYSQLAKSLKGRAELLLELAKEKNDTELEKKANDLLEKAKVFEKLAK